MESSNAVLEEQENIKNKFDIFSEDEDSYSHIYGKICDILTAYEEDPLCEEAISAASKETGVDGTLIREFFSQAEELEKLNNICKRRIERLQDCIKYFFRLKNNGGWKRTLLKNKRNFVRKEFEKYIQELEKEINDKKNKFEIEIMNNLKE